MQLLKYGTLAFLALIMNLTVLNAQPRSIGAVFSTSGLGVQYDHCVESGNYFSVDIMMDTDNLIWENVEHPGVAASFTWNIIFAEKTSSYGNRVSFFAGPGIMAGYVTDLSSKAGFAFGMKGRIGIECRFKRPFILSACIAPTLGIHLTSEIDHVSMKIYKSGLAETIAPQIGIKYAF